jgi:transposase
VISQGLPIYVALEPVDMRMGYERLGGLVRERMRSEPRSKALFVFVGKRGHTMIQGLLRIRAIYAADDHFRKLPPATRKLARDEHVRPLIDAFFEWVQQARLEQKGRNVATKALGYATNQEHELRRVLADGRLPLDNTRAERSLRKIVVGRKNWMF